MKTRLTSVLGLFMEIAEHFAQNGLFCVRFILNSVFPRKSSNGWGRSPATQAAALKSAKNLNSHRLFSANPHAFLKENIHSLLPYADVSIKNLIWDFKYRLRTGATIFFSDIMSDEIISFLTDTLGNSPLSMPALLVYCPSSSFASGKKEWDQMKELSLLIERRTAPFLPYVNVCVDAIELNERTSSKTQEQHTGTRKERLTWAKGKYRVSKGFKEYLKQTQQSGRNVHIICMDDILTTGATLQAVFTAVTSASAETAACKLSAFTLCFTERHDPPKKSPQS